MNNAELFERAKAVSPGGVHSPVRGFRGVGGVPKFVVRAQGAEIQDAEGAHYIDYCQSWGPLVFGHRDPDVEAAVREALTRGWSYGAAEPYSLALAERITSRLPWVEKIRFVSSGTEAVMSALRVARAATNRSKILKFDGCYHGHVDSMLVRAGSGLAEMASPDSAGVSAAVASETIVVPLDRLDAVQAAFDKHGAEIAAVIVEGIPANNGLLLQRADFLDQVAAIARKAGALFVLDEVITGFRVGFGGIAATLKNAPDLVTYGKVIGGGFPVGAYAGRRDLMDLVAPAGPVYQAGTLSANPVAMAAGLAMLTKLADENPYARLAERTERLSRRIESASSEAGSPARLRVQNVASLFWIVMDASQGNTETIRSIEQIPGTQKEKYAKLFHHLLAQRIYLAPSGYEVSFLSTAHTDAQLDGLVQGVRSWLQQ